MRKHFDVASLTVIIVTFVLFIVALFTKGFTHDFLLEVGIFLISVKLIMMAYKSSVSVKSIENELKEIKRLLKSDQ
jgi:flagellar motor component MotA